ncbi:hypothetical protein LL972_10680 [Xanthomonas campestris pv. asclepiadis]|uniref:hypothetical protein n=1 Tax=Xanthomonas campestris TaxID=339 RepID=UPI001E359CD8|nr:hypothetical protein [Xanthomonas campestris]MCC4616461.1 hypothetical protein [Xanthomonas campestris pv. asclepiadis]
MRVLCILMSSLALLPLGAFAQSGWVDGQGQSVAASPSRNTAQDFGASLPVTSDVDREQQRNTPDRVPQVKAVAHVGPGDALFAQ